MRDLQELTEHIDTKYTTGISEETRQKGTHRIFEEIMARTSQM